uniref:Uncharacterized protein n=1 Tax=Cyprinus carpio TaxID=7962 RepID=A0A8C2I6F3_CYPCA
MAFRLLVRRVSGVSCSSRLNTSQPLLPLSSCRSASFTVQDHQDFTDRVIHSRLPVLIDFHAQYVQENQIHLQPARDFRFQTPPPPKK